ncbi:MAG: hypothetical protein ABIO57_00300 [Candidatus Paceibacterota bacterium]
MFKKLISNILILSVIVSMMPATALIATAASLSAMSDTMSSQTISANSSHVIRFTTPTGAGTTAQTIVITFPSGFNFTSKTIGTVSFTHGASTGAESTETLAASPSATAWGAAFSGTSNVILTLTTPTDGVGSAVLAPNDKVIITYDSTNSINPGTAANYAITLNANGDTGSITVPIITNSQVAITATVDQSLSFSVSNNAIGFGSLTTSNSRFATSNGLGASAEPTNAHTLSASTNAASGYSVAVSGATLTSGANTITAIPGATATALAPATEQFGIRGNLASGSGSLVAPFNGAAGSYGFGTSPLTTQPFASSSGASATSVYNVNYAANIAALTEAGSYTTTLTYVATANF